MERARPMACQKVQKHNTKVRLNKKTLFFHTKETVSQINVEVYIYLSLHSYHLYLVSLLSGMPSLARLCLHFHLSKKKEPDLPVATAWPPIGHTVEAVVCLETLCNRHRSL